MQQRFIYLQRSQKDEATNGCLQEHSSDCLSCHIKGKAKQASELVKVQSDLCENTLRLSV